MASRPGRVTGKAARRNKWYSKRRNQWIAAGVVLAVVGAGGWALALSGSDSEPEQTAGDRWKSEVTADFAGMSQGAVSYLQTVNDWRVNKAQEENVDAAADLALNQFLVARDAVAARQPFAQAPRALLNYQDSIEIYIVTARLAKLGAGLPAAADAKLQNQIQLMMGRVRYVADRLFDLGGDELAPFITQGPDVDGFDYQRAVDVPSFAGTDLAPGPPLAQSRPGVPANREYQKIRPEGPFADWQAAVEAAKIPSVETEVNAIEAASVEELGKLAERLDHGLGLIVRGNRARWTSVSSAPGPTRAADAGRAMRTARSPGWFPPPFRARRPRPPRCWPWSATACGTSASAPRPRLSPDLAYGAARCRPGTATGHPAAGPPRDGRAGARSVDRADADTGHRADAGTDC